MLKFFQAGSSLLEENYQLPKTMRFRGDPAQQWTFYATWLPRGGYLYGF